MQLWTKEHAITLLPTFAVMIVIAIILALTLGKKKEKYRMIPIKIIAVVLVIIEIIKQVQSIMKGYNLYFIPLHFCSLFIFFLPLFAFYNGKFKEHIKSFTFTACAMMSIFILVYPDLIYGASDITTMGTRFLSFHTVVFHNLVLFAFILMIALKLYNINTKRDIISLLIGFSIFCSISAPMAQILKTNFNNFFTCNIAPIQAFVDTIKNSIGYTLGQTIYVLIVCILDIVFAFISYGVLRIILKLRETKRIKKPTSYISIDETTNETK